MTEANVRAMQNWAELVRNSIQAPPRSPVRRPITPPSRPASPPKSPSGRLRRLDKQARPGVEWTQPGQRDRAMTTLPGLERSSDSHRRPGRFRGRCSLLGVVRFQCRRCPHRRFQIARKAPPTRAREGTGGT